MHATTKTSLDFQEPEEPSITSSDPNERKLARRLRIQRRLKALTKQDEIKEEKAVAETLTERQILASLSLLDTLEVEGNEVVSSVKIANDARELQRRKEEQDMRKNLLEKLEEEGNECVKMYEEITKKWPDILASKDPLDIHAEMESQNAKCLEVLAKKDAVIAHLKQELEKADLMFVEDQENQTESIDILIERMENQINTMAKAYRREIEFIDNAIESERKTLLKTAAEKWEILYKKLQDEGQEGIEKRKQIMREYEQEMDRVITEHQEEFRAQKINFELEIQKLQQEVENTKALCLMNIEKLDYSYAVIKCREDENAIIKNYQKRKINKLQDVINNLKKTYTELEENTRNEIQKLTDQVLKTHKTILDLQEKSDHFTSVNEKQYLQIWDMNVKNANELLDKILTTDRILYEQLLGLEWQPPEQTLLKKEDLPSYRNVISAIGKEKERIRERKKIVKSYKPATTLEEINLERRLLNHIIKQISEKTGYLIEDCLNDLLLPYTENDNVIIRLDNIFQALDITMEEELGYLLHFFLPYAYCPTCDAEAASPTPQCVVEEIPSEISNICPDVPCDGVEFTEEETKLIETIKQEVFADNLPLESDKSSTENSRSVSFLSQPPIPDNEEGDSSSCTYAETEITEDSEEKKSRFLCDKGHFLEIQTTHVTRALKEFIEKYHIFKRGDTPVSFKEKLSVSKLSISRSLTVEDVTEFWKRYRDMFSEKKERLWDGLLVGLKKYYEILKERHQLNLETESLRKQNAELQYLLKTYTESDK